MGEKTFLDTEMDEFIGNYIGLYPIESNSEYHFIIEYIKNLKELIVNLNELTFLYLPEETIRIMERYLRSKDKQAGKKVIEEFGITRAVFDKKSYDFHKAVENEIYKGIYRMRNGISYDVNSKGGVGLHVLNLTFQSYNLLREKHFNTVQDLISVCTYRLYSLTGSVCFTDILRKVHFLGYKFIDEQDKDIDDLRNTDLKKLVKSYKSIRK